VTASFVSAALEFIDDAEERGAPFYVNLWPDDVHSPFFPPKARRGDAEKGTLYRGVLDTMDEQLGVLFDHVRGRATLRDKTLILVCSDNGPEPGAGSAGPFRGTKAMLYEGGVRSPLIAWGPGLIHAERVGTANRTSVFSAIDLVPTLLAITGIEAPDGIRFDGQPLPGVLLGRSQASRAEPLFFRRPPDRDQYRGVTGLPDLAVRHERWKLLCEYDGSEARLYDLDADPGETTDLSARHPDVAKRLTAAVVAWHRSVPPDNGATYVDPRKSGGAHRRSPSGR
jgi:uncharacterized sulfatase